MKISHVGYLDITIESIEEALPYYENVSGLRCYSIETIEDQRIRTAFLKVGDVKIGSLKPTSSENTIIRFIERNNGNGGVHYLALIVEGGVANGLTEIEEKGIRPTGKTLHKGAGGLNTAFLHLKSTLNVLIELCEKGE